MSTKGFQRESNGFEPTLHIPRPQSNHAAFRDLSPEALVIAVEHWDEANRARIDNEAMKKRAAEYDDSPEGDAARAQHRSIYQGI